ncbi:MAG: glycoside hydrolase family 13 protein [Propionibacteriaceae bacterium]|jgi:alpha-glucosidase|nr:glycoside hydrolase family 13 protein [Propionibacteriaceae bacterium]
MTAVDLLDRPHHDGSALYVPPGPHRLGDRLPVRLRVPLAWGETGCKLWVMRDGDPLRLPARLAAEDGRERWYEATLPVDNPEVRYRWLLTRPGGYNWVTARGVFDRDLSSAGDFRLTVHAPPPAWADAAVAYQIVPDRFARSGRVDAPVPAWALPMDWDTPPAPGGPTSVRQWYGGDLFGIADRADYLADLGVDLVYLTPFFPAGSTHRYDAATFEAVDPLLGGDEGLAALTEAMHARGIRVIGDLTANHTGNTHEWFRRALAARRGEGPPAEEEAFYYWPETSPLDLGAWQQVLDDQWTAPAAAKPRRAAPEYVSWLGVPSLPKLNWNSEALVRRMIAGPDSVVGRYLRPPFDLDGWRIDVAHMTGRFAADDRYAMVARTIRATMDAVKPGSLLIGEHFFDVSRDLPGDGWHAIMNYAAFLKPVWSWLASDRLDPSVWFLDVSLPVPRRDGGQVVATMREFGSTTAWPQTSHAWNMLDSHDSSRILSIADHPAVAEVGAAWLLTYPGIPAVFAGTEGGARGATGEESRVTMPWDEIAQGGGPRWDAQTCAAYRELIALRRREEALRRGGLRWAFVGADALGYLRETADATLLVALARAPWEGVLLPGLAGGRTPTAVYEPKHAACLSLEAAAEGLRVGGEGPALGVWRL